MAEANSSADMLDVWNKVLTLLKREMNSVDYNNWMVELKPVMVAGDLFVLQATNEIHLRFALSFLDTIQQALDLLYPDQYRADIRLQDEIEELRSKKDTRRRSGQADHQGTSMPAQTNPMRMPPVGYTSTLNPQLTFENFIVGDGNRFAAAACKAVAANDGEGDYNPLFLYGGSGLGKTHLLHSIGNFVHKEQTGRRMIYVQCEQFVNEFIYAIQKNLYDDFRKKYRNVDLLLIDDIQFIEGKEQMQVEFFYTFNALYENGSNIVLTCDKPPTSLASLEERLRTRFSSGLTVDIQAPDYETRVAILKSNAQQSNTDFPDDVYDYIATNFSSNIRELEGAFKTVRAYAMLAGTNNLEIAKTALKDMISPAASRKATPKIVIDLTARFYGVTAEDITSPKRNKEIAWPRQVAMYLCREVLNMTYEQIGEVFNRHYSTVIHNVDLVAQEASDEGAQVNQDLHELTKRL